MVARIREAGVDHVVLSTSYRADVFASYFGDGSRFGVQMEYVVESEPLGTGGGIRNVADHLHGEDVLIFNGDVLSGVDLGAVLRTHTETRSDVTLYLTKVHDPRAYGCVPTDADGRVTAFCEKDPYPVSDQINAGTYVFKRSVISSIPAGRAVSVERETFPGLLAEGARIAGHVDLSYWRDLGRPSDFVAGSADLVLGLAPSPALPGPVGQSLRLPGARVDPAAAVSGGSTVGANAVVGAGAVVEGSVLFDGAVVGAGAVVRRTVLGFGAVVHAGAVVEDAVIGDRARIGSGVELRAGVRVWPDVTVPDGSIRFSPDV
jgi:mannose-1-phosphate guanylyltransferase